MSPRSLAVVRLARGSTPRRYLLDDEWVSDVRWAADSQSVFLLTTDRTFGRREHMFEQPIVRVAIDSGKAERVDRGAVANAWKFYPRAQADGQDGRARHPPAQRSPVLRADAGARGDAANLEWFRRWIH